MNNSKLTKTNKKEIKKILSERYNLINNSSLNNFISLYMDCEATARKIIYYYDLKVKQKKKKERKKFTNLYCPTIVKVVSYFEINISRDLIVSIFSSDRTLTRNHKTPRMLRNGVIHEKKIQDIIEIENRYDFLKKIMEEWLNIVNYI